MKYAKDYKVKNSKRTEKGVFSDIKKLERILKEHYKEYDCSLRTTWTFNCATVLCVVDTHESLSIRPRLICRLYDDETVEILLPETSEMYEKVYNLFSYKIKEAKAV